MPKRSLRFPSTDEQRTDTFAAYGNTRISPVSAGIPFLRLMFLPGVATMGPQWLEWGRRKAAA
jgi:hypothetical protein